MDDFIFLCIIAAVISVLGAIAWWALVIFGAFKVAKATNRQFEALLMQAIQLTQQLQTMPPGQRAATQVHVSQVLSNVGSQFNQFDDLARQRYDLRVSELMGMAASAGIDWRP